MWLTDTDKELVLASFTCLLFVLGGFSLLLLKAFISSVWWSPILSWVFCSSPLAHSDELSSYGLDNVEFVIISLLNTQTVCGSNLYNSTYSNQIFKSFLFMKTLHLVALGWLMLLRGVVRFVLHSKHSIFVFGYSRFTSEFIFCPVDLSLSACRHDTAEN